MYKKRSGLFVGIIAVGLCAAALGTVGCGEKATPLDTNLLKNSSFEEVADGLPVNWEVKSFKGLDTEIPAEWGIDEERATDGKNSFFFMADQETRRFFVLTQGVKVKDVERIRVRGDIKTLEVKRNYGQFQQSNYALTFYDVDGNRFQSGRFYDLRTEPRIGTSDGWISEDRIYRLPDNTVYVEFHCALGMEGKVWFDNITLDVPAGIAWNTSESKNFTFHWFSGSEYPEGSQEFQQELFDYYCQRLNIPEADRPHISSFFYPDSSTLFQTIGSRSPKKSYWDEREVHSIYPVDDHEIIHIVTKPYGILPLPLTEGTAYYLMENYNGTPVLKVAQDILKDGNLPSLQSMLSPGIMRKINPDIVAPSAASFVGYLLEIGGPGKFLDLHREGNAANSPQEFATAFERVYGLSIVDAEAEWKKLLGRLDFSAEADSTSTGPGQ